VAAMRTGGSRVKMWLLSAMHVLKCFDETAVHQGEWVQGVGSVRQIVGWRRWRRREQDITRARGCAYR